MKQKKSTLEQLKNIHKIPKLKRIQHTSRDNNFDEILQVSSLPELTPRLPNNEIEQTQNQPDENVEIFEPMQPQDFSDDDDCEYLESAFEKNTRANNRQCRFEAPFMPIRKTAILIPLDKKNPELSILKSRFNSIRRSLEDNNYDNIEHFCQSNNITLDGDYINI